MIDREASLYDITQEYPATIPVFASNGFPHMTDAAKRAAMGKSISLSSALLLKQMDADAFVRLLEDAVLRSGECADVTLDGPMAPVDDDSPTVVGILPCPVRIPLMEKWTGFLDAHRQAGNGGVKHELRAASMGLDWVQENIEGVESADELPDLFISAGFDMFFDKERMGRFRDEGAFTDISGITEENGDFSGLDIRDPEGRYSIISVVPAMFLVNTAELGDREAPRTWADLLHPRFERSVSLPVGDFDLFNAILLNIYKEHGDDGIRALGRSLLASMHPSQMVKSHARKDEKPAVTIMPYFFSRMAKAGGTMKAVWPEDGAIISPIFMLAKASKANQIRPIVEFFASKDVGDILSSQGLFPSTHPEVKNQLPEGGRFSWLGWDYIMKHDLSEIIGHCEELFNEASQDLEANTAEESA